MSKYHKEQIECPHCHHKGEFDLWESVNVDLDPELRGQILSDRLLRSGSCSKVLVTLFSFLLCSRKNR